MKRRSRARLAMDIVARLIKNYPVSWKASELALVTKETLRTVQRALTDMMDAGLVEKHYTAYRIRTTLATQMYDARWYLKNETDKNFMIEKIKGGYIEHEQDKGQQAGRDGDDDHEGR